LNIADQRGACKDLGIPMICLGKKAGLGWLLKQHDFPNLFLLLYFYHMSFEYQRPLHFNFKQQSVSRWWHTYTMGTNGWALSSPHHVIVYNKKMLVLLTYLRA
jgi:hypothetical protein